MDSVKNIRKRLNRIKKIKEDQKRVYDSITKIDDGRRTPVYDDSFRFTTSLLDDFVASCFHKDGNLFLGA